MATLGTQNISTSYPQLLKVSGNTPFTGTLVAIASGDESSVSALQISTLGVSSSGTLNSAGATTLASSLAVTGAATFSSSISATTGTVTIGTATISTATISTATISTATISTATIPLQLGAITFGSNITSSTGTATIGTATISTSTISSATIPRINGVTTFATGFTSSTGTNTIGTIASTTISNTGLATVGTLEIGATGPNITKVSFGTAAFTLSTVSAYNAAGTTNGTFALTGSELGDMVIGSLNSLGTVGGSTGLIIGFHPIASNVVRYSITNPTTTAGTVPAGTIFATAMRFTD